MEQRALHEILCEVLEPFTPDATKQCYFQPPADLEMKYPCIRYDYTNDNDDFADNIRYRCSKKYTVIIIDEDPDSKIPDELKKLPYCISDRNFTADGLNHFVYTLFFSGPRITIKEE